MTKGETFAFAKELVRRANRESRCKVTGERDAELRERILERGRQEFREIVAFTKLLHEDYMAVTGEEETAFFITCRPPEEIPLADLWNCTHRWVNRACINKYMLSFEQKGISDETLGTGRHVHMMCWTKHRSKGECLRDCISTFKSICPEHAVDVRSTREGTKMFRAYCVDYSSSDGHKEATREWDERWRQTEQIASQYGSDSQELPRSLNKPM